MNNISPDLPKSRSITVFRSVKVPGPFDALANSAKSSRPTPAFSAATTASKGLEDVRLNRSISTLRIDILPPRARLFSHYQSAALDPALEFGYSEKGAFSRRSAND